MFWLPSQKHSNRDSEVRGKPHWGELAPLFPFFCLSKQPSHDRRGFSELRKMMQQELMLLWASPACSWLLGQPSVLGLPSSTAGGKQLLQPWAPSALCPSALLSSTSIIHCSANNLAAGSKRRSPTVPQADAGSEQPGAAWSLKSVTGSHCSYVFPLRL